ncbi:MAG: glycoside hydrolase family 2 TIM barrel-domain containing protein [Bacteroidales bacterium]
MIKLIFPLFLSLSLMLLSCSADNINNQSINNRNLPFDTGWKFLRDGVSGAENPSFDDSGWRTLDLPHDWSIENFADSDNEDHIGPFTKTSEGGVSTGHVKGGTGWYRKHFKADNSYRMKNVSVCFDGVYMITTVWVNGKKAGDHFYGYTPFSFDISGLLIPGSDNVIAVEVKNPGKNSRWYSGSGIYRHVWLTITNPLRVAENGLYVKTNLLSQDTAQIQLSVKLKNSDPKNSEGKLVTLISDMDDRVIAKTEKLVEIEPNGTLSVEQSLKITQPFLWSVDNPHLYRATSQVVVKGHIIDSYSVQFGVRTIEYSAGRGFLLNKNPLKLKGACMHNDNGLLGSAAFDRAEERRIEIMKANGYNAIRTSHNPPSKQFLDACDRLGMLVIDEAFDMWEHPKNPSDYSNYFKANWKNDLQSMILRDRNHASVIAWSIGNEIYERADTSGQRIAGQLVRLVKSLDNSRPVTAAVCLFWDHPGTDWSASAKAFASLDLAGYNYEWREYENDHKKYPDRIMTGTESFPMEAFENWQQVEKDSWVIGDFVWTGMDYLGESGIGHVYYDKRDASFSMPWPWYNSWCGDIDITGQKKAQSYFRDVVWGRSSLEMAVHTPLPAGKKEGISMWGWPAEYQSWTWPGDEGDTLQVSVYSRCQEVRLELNGKVIGQKQISDATRLTAKFTVPYSPGVLKVIGIINGKEVATKVFKTAGKPSHLILSADRTRITADRNDLTYVSVEVRDKDENLVPNTDIIIKFTVSGVGELLASGNAAPDDMQSFRKPECKTFNGKCLAIIRPYAKAGSIKVNAEAAGLPNAMIEILTR